MTKQSRKEEAKNELELEASDGSDEVKTLVHVLKLFPCVL